jgi:uncharacterized membrane protein YuzA (DUF378 family)
MKTFDVIAAVLLVVGGLNWGLVGLFDFDLVATLFGSVPVFSTIVYALVGVAALYQIAGLRWIQKRWNVSPRLAPAG